MSFDANVLIPGCRDGDMLINKYDTFAGRSLRMYGEWAFRDIEVTRRLLNPGDVVLDVGANIGTFSVAYGKTIGQGGHLHAFEPQRLLFQLLCANVAINNLPNVTCYPCAAGAEMGSIRVPTLDYSRPVSIGQNNYGSLSLGGDQGESVQLIAIDSLPLAGCNLIKADVEGMELQVLQGAYKTIMTYRPFLYVENDRPRNTEALTRFLHVMRYRLYLHAEPLYNPENHFGNAENIFEDWRSINLLCIPQESPLGFDESIFSSLVELPR